MCLCTYEEKHQYGCSFLLLWFILVSTSTYLMVFVLNEQIQVLLIYISKWFPTHTYTHTYECSMMQWTQKVVLLNLKLGYTPWCKWLLNESRFLLHKMFLEKYFSLNAIMCSHWSEGTITESSRNTQTLNQDLHFTNENKSYTQRLFSDCVQKRSHITAQKVAQAF